jgi:hypothetical protein
MANQPARKFDPLQDPMFQPSEPAMPGAPDPIAAGQAVFPPLAEGDSYAMQSPSAAPAPEMPPLAPETAVPAPAPAPIPMGSSVAKTVTQDQRIVQSPEEKAAAKALNTANQKDVEATKAQQGAEAKAALADAEATRQQMAQQQEIAAEQNRQLEEADLDRRARDTISKQEITAAEEQVKRDQAESGKTPFTGNIGGAIFAALISGSSTKQAFILGKDPADMPAVRTIDRYLEQDKQNRLAKLASSKEWLAEKRKGPEAAKAAWQDAVDRIEIQSAARLRMAVAAAETLKANSKVDPARFQAIAQAAVAQKEASAAEAAYRLAQRSSITRTTETTRVPNAGADPKNLVRWRGQNYNVGDEVSARQMRDKAGATEGLVQQLDELEAAIQKYKTTPLSMGKERADVEANIARLTGAIKSSQSLGALDKGVQTLVSSMVSDPTSLKNWIFKGGREGSLSTIRAAKQEAIAGVENGLSANPATGFQRQAPAAASVASGVSPDRLKAGLRAALRAGDTAAARKIAEEIKRLGG